MGLSRRAVSDAIGVTERAIQDWESPNETAIPTADKFLAMAALYRSDLSALVPAPDSRPRETPALRKVQGQLERELDEFLREQSRPEKRPA